MKIICVMQQRSTLLTTDVLESDELYSSIKRSM